MFEQRLTPKDFGLKVRDNCDELQITASNKMRNAYSLEVQSSFYGRFFETPYISLNTKQNKKNWEQVALFTNKLFTEGYKFRFAEIGKYDDTLINDKNGASRFFEKVPKDEIITFLSHVKCSMVNMFFNIPDILTFLRDPENIGIENWNVVFVGGESDKFYDIPGLENIRCADRTICDSTKHAIQITSRRRLLSASAGKLALSPAEINIAEESQRRVWQERGCSKEEAERRSIPMNTYFSELQERVPVLYIVLVEPRPATHNEEPPLPRFRADLGSDKIVAFGIGLPATVNGNDKSCHFMANKIYHNLNMMDDINESEEEDEE
jgi:hypothetical protein